MDLNAVRFWSAAEAKSASARRANVTHKTRGVMTSQCPSLTLPQAHIFKVAPRSTRVETSFIKIVLVSWFNYTLT